VIAYVAAQGPAMLKHPEKAFDYNTTCSCSDSVQRWNNHVLQEYGSNDDPTLKQAFAEIIIEEYAARYKTLVDGWWFDQGNYADIPALSNVIMQHNPNAAVAFNTGQKVPLTVNSPGYEHFTAGHPTPVKSAAPYDAINLPMITSVESTPDGFLDDGNGDLSLGHVYMPTSEDSWNTVFKPVAWDVAQAAEWKSRVQAAGGAWTWNLPRDSNGATLSLLDLDHVQFVMDVEDAINAPSAAPSSAPSPAPSADAYMESMVVTDVTSDWKTVALSPGFVSPIPACTVKYEGYIANPMVVRIQNLQSSSFDIKLQNPSGVTPLAPFDVHCLVVEEGSWTMPDGTNIEAQSYSSSRVDYYGSWVGELQTYRNSYTQPVVLGQVLSYNDANWSTFWSRGTSRIYRPSPSRLQTGMHIGHGGSTRLSETIGFIVMERGHGGSDGSDEYEAGFTSDTIKNYNYPHAYRWAHSYAQTFENGTPVVTIATQAAMDGVDGSWAVLSGDGDASTLRLAVDEDKVFDAERAHTHEEVMYVAFDTERTVELSAIV
jgi:hypothetical protein